MRTKKKFTVNWLVVFVIIAGIGYIISSVETHPEIVLGSIGVLLVLFAAFLINKWICRPLYERWRENRILRDASKVVMQHEKQLAINRKRLCFVDDYDHEDTSRWIAHIHSFLKNKFEPDLSPEDLRRFQERLIDDVTSYVDRFAARTNLPTAPYQSTSTRIGVDFELQCLEQLRACGWDARGTPASGDQGADIIAEKSGNKLIIQCKCYSSPIGNKAVQEIFGAQHYYKAKYCCVISNQSYTRSAQSLASVNNVLLLHFDDIFDIDGMLNNSIE